MIRKIAAAVGACGVLAFPPPAHGVDGVSAELGYGDDETKLLRFAVQWQWNRQWPVGQDWRVTGYWDLSAAAWDNRDESVADVGLTPVFRLQRGAPYLEAAIGLHLVSRHISAERVFSTSFQFGSHLGAGVRLRSCDVGVLLQHISNGSLRTPNPGINFVLLRLQYSLE